MAFAAYIAFAATVVLAPLRARYVLLARPVPQVYMDFSDFLVFASDASMLLLLALWCLSMVFALRPITLGPKFITFPLLGLLLAGLVSTISSLDAALSFYYVFRLIVLFLFYLYVINEIHLPLLIIVPVAFQTVFHAVSGVMQFLLQHSVGLHFFGEHSLDPDWGGVSVLFDGSTRLLRAYGLTEHPNVLGGCLAFGLILFLAAYCYGNRQARRGTALFFLLALLGLFVTFSRSAWLAFLVASGFLIGALVLSRRWDDIKSLAWLGLTSAIMLAPFVCANMDFIGARLNLDDSFQRNPLENRSINERRLLNEAALDIFLGQPLTGTGLGTSALAIKEYAPQLTSYVPPHFTLLAVAVETGILGGVCYLSLLLLPWWALIRKMKNLTAQPLLVTTSALLLAITFVGFFDIYPWLLAPGRFWQWLAWGVWAVVYEKSA